MVLTEKDFFPKNYPAEISSGKVSASAPSNIALVKYWGKYGEQFPKNASISFTLNNCKTETTLHFEEKILTEKEFDFSVFFEGKENLAFELKIRQFFERIVQYVPFLKEYSFRIETENTFPHSSGIASSASGMAALALCLMKIEKQLLPEMSEEFFLQKASFLARLGSGSACRSIYDGLVVWGKHPEIPNSSNLYGTKYSKEVHEIFHQFCDVILLVDGGQKKVSSSVGHALMNDHPFAEARFLQAENNLTSLQEILKSGDLTKFIERVESEALSLHAMMMTAKPYFLLIKPNTLKIIEKIWEFREQTGLHLCFTLDAGAN
ncbi:MAG TPA: diphosphomevalonate decarboxylase, partial [Flavobacteriaceae bacterium]|nr:diphosphomevalonate decarboxylase [Flavobacteriaceae bacterium]